MSNCRGPDFGRLARGHTVQSATTRQMVTPDMCMEEATPGEVVAVVECPNERFLASLEELCAPLGRVANLSSSAQVRVLLHLTPAQVLEHPQYQQWIQALPDWEHLVAGKHFDPAVDAPSLRSSHVMQVLSLLCCCMDCLLTCGIHSIAPRCGLQCSARL
jgi:hypothetical protein